MKKRLLSLFLALALLCALVLPATAVDSDFVVKNGKLTRYTGSGGAVAIPDGVTSIGNNVFFNQTGLTSITIPNSVTNIGKSTFNGCTGLTSITIPNSVTSIGGGAFNGCTGLTSITIPSSVTSIGDRTFGYCTCLTNITVEDNNPKYSSQDGVLFSKDRTQLICYPGGKTGDYTIPGGVTSIEYSAFSNCAGLTGIMIPNSVVSIGDSAFGDCIGLTGMTIPNSVTSIGDSAFLRCENLTSVNIPNSVTSIGAGAFSSCTGLTSITIPNGVTSIGDSAFHNCTGLTSMTIPNSVTSVGNYAFSACTDLTSVIFPNGIARIGDSTFLNCTGLTSVTIPASVTAIEKYAFYTCTGLTDVYYAGTEAQWGKISIGKLNESLIGATIHYNSAASDTAVTPPPAAKIVLRLETGNIIVETEKGQPMKAPANPVKEGYTFGGWYGDEALTSPWNFNAPVTGDMTLYAKWTPVSSSATQTGKSSQTITVDGKKVELDAYTLKADSNGGDVTYVKLRDVAAVLNGTQAQFDVQWLNGAIYVAAQTPYVSQNGTELKSIATKDNSFQWNTNPILFSGVIQPLEGIILIDKNEGGHTFFKLRDLGAAIGFKVDWSAEQGIFIETK